MQDRLSEMEIKKESERERERERARESGKERLYDFPVLILAVLIRHQ